MLGFFVLLGGLTFGLGMIFVVISMFSFLQNKTKYATFMMLSWLSLVLGWTSMIFIDALTNESFWIDFSCMVFCIVATEFQLNYFRKQGWLYK